MASTMAVGSCGRALKPHGVARGNSESKSNSVGLMKFVVSTEKPCTSTDLIPTNSSRLHSLGPQPKWCRFRARAYNQAVYR